MLVPETTDVVFEEYNGKLVLVSGTLSITDPLKDATYGISINAVKLRKIVQVRENIDSLQGANIDFRFLTFFAFWITNLNPLVPADAKNKNPQTSLNWLLLA